MKKVIDVSTKRYVTDGPQLWVSSILYLRGQISTNKIWEEYQKDDKIEDRNMISSKTFLKRKILHVMECQGKIEKASAQDVLRPN